MHSPAPTEFMRFTAPDAAELARTIKFTQESLDAAESRGDSSAMVDHAADLGGMLTTARRESEALELLRRYEALAESLSTKEQAAWFWNAMATALQYGGKRAQAEAYFSRSVELAREGGWSRIEAMALHHWGRSLVEQGRLDEAELRISQALTIRDRLEERNESSRNALQKLAQLRSAGDA
jgi:tetratricopeptide (TPR) repeat protein